LRLEPRNPRGYEEGSMGWFVDEQKLSSRRAPMRTWLTGIVRKEESPREIVHMKFSVGVQTKRVLELRKLGSRN